MIFQILSIIIAFAIQISFPALLKIGSTFPNLVLVLAVFISFAYSRRKALGSALAGGILLDVFSGMPFGLSMLLMLVIVFLVEEAKFFLFADLSLLAFLAAVLGATIFYNIFSFLGAELLYWLNKEIFLVNGSYLFFSVLPKEILYNLISAAALYLLWILAKFLTGYRESWR